MSIVQIEINQQYMVNSQNIERPLSILQEQYPVFTPQPSIQSFLEIDNNIENVVYTKTIKLDADNVFDIRRPTSKIVVVKPSILNIEIKSLTKTLFITDNDFILIEGPRPGDILVQNNIIYIFHDWYWVFLGFDSGNCESQLYIQENEPVSLIGDRWLNPVTGFLVTRTTNIADEAVWSELYYSSGVCVALDLVYDDTPPLSPNIGDRWFDSSSGVLYTFIQDFSGDFLWVDTTA